MKPYYETRDGRIVMYHGDNRDVLPKLADGCADLVVTSPPYNLGGKTNHNLRSSRPRSRAQTRWDRPALAAGYGAHTDDLPYAEYVAWQRGLLSECWRLLSDTGAIFYNHKPLIRDKELRLPLDLNPGLPLRQIITWDRGSGFNFSRTHFLPVTEWLMLFAKPAFELRDVAASKASDLWRIDFEQGTPHPAPFPPEVPLQAIGSTTAAAVLDPHAGWGTTLLAAKLLGRRAIGIELEERFCEMAATRLSQETLPLFGDVA